MGAQKRRSGKGQQLRLYLSDCQTKRAFSSRSSYSVSGGCWLPRKPQPLHTVSVTNSGYGVTPTQTPSSPVQPRSELSQARALEKIEATSNFEIVSQIFIFFSSIHSPALPQNFNRGSHVANFVTLDVQGEEMVSI